MSIVPEYVLQSTIVRGVKRMRTDAKLIDQLFRNLDRKSVDQVRDFIKTSVFDLCINYPRTTPKVPAIIMTLKSDKEEQAFLGDSMGMEFPDEFSFDGAIDGALPGVASVSTADGNPTVVFGPANAFTGTKNTVRAAELPWISDQFVTRRHKIRLVQGTGVGQIRDIVANSQNVVMVSPDWLVIPDSTTVFEVVTPPEELIGEPTTLFDRRGEDTPERRGGIYRLNYQVQVICTTPELTIYLCIILRAIFYFSKMFMERQGLMDFSMGATDFTPKTELQPDLTYMRALSLDFLFPFDVFESFGGVARSFHLILEGEPSVDLAVRPVLSDTTWEEDAGGNLVNDLSDVQRVYFGSANPPGSFDANFIQNTLGTEGTAIASDFVRVVNYVTGAGQKMYYALPSRFGVLAGNFIDAQTSLPVGFTNKATVSVTTTFGTEPYDVWESDNAFLGFVAVSVQQ